MVRNYQQHFQNLSPNLKLFLLGHALMAFGNSVHSLLFNLFLKEAGLKEGVMGSLASTTSLGTSHRVPSSVCLGALFYQTYADHRAEHFSGKLHRTDSLFKRRSLHTLWSAWSDGTCDL